MQANNTISINFSGWAIYVFYYTSITGFQTDFKGKSGGKFSNSTASVENSILDGANKRAIKLFCDDLKLFDDFISCLKKIAAMMYKILTSLAPDYMKMIFTKHAKSC